MFSPKTEKIVSVKWNGEGTVDFTFDGCSWSGAKRKDFWNPDDEWETVLVPGAIIRTWVVQGSIVMGFEVWNEHEDTFTSVWCMANNFQTKEERVAGDKAYNNFIVSEGCKIANLIDHGKSLKQIDKLIDDQHSGNTYACALALGISKAVNRKNAEKIKKAHNKIWGVKGAKGVVNPCVVTLKTK